MIRYYKYQNNSNIESVKGKWFLRIKNGEQIDLEGLAKHMADHASPYSKGVIYGVLTDMVSCIKELLSDGKTVKLADLAIFSLGVKCIGADNPDNATVQNIRSIRIKARGTGELSSRTLKEQAHFKEMDEYARS